MRKLVRFAVVPLMSLAGIVATVGAASAAPAVGQSITAYPSAKTVSYTFSAQENGFYCGPASVRTALTARGVWQTQGVLADFLGTTTNGTNSSADTTRVLNNFTRTSFYQTKWVPYPYSQTHINLLKQDILTDANLGWVIVANVLGSQVDTGGFSHSYSGGHYLTVVGYTNKGDVAVIEDVAISASGRHKYSMTTSRLLDWIANKGYSA